MAAQTADQIEDAAPDQRLTAGQPEFAGATPHERSRQPVDLLEAQHLGLGQERHRFGHAIDAAEIAAIGNRYAQVGDLTAERIDKRAIRRRRTVEEGGHGHC